MRKLKVLACIVAVSVAAACGDDAIVNETSCCTTGEPALRVVNAFSSSVDVLIDGKLAISALAPGAIDTAASTSGSHSVILRRSGSAESATQSVTTSSGALSTVAVVRLANGSVAGAMLDDTNSVVPAGATKVRVLHLAPNAGTLQVYRTQPDFQQPISWQFPFDYQPEPTALGAPFFQSTVGTWDIRIWQVPADASGWNTAPLKISIPLAGGEKRTVLLLDKPGGGVRAELL